MPQGVTTWNIANILTIIRIAAVPIFVFCFWKGFQPGHAEFYLWAAWIIFLIAAVTDRLDGHYARKYNIITPLGEFLDPVADKFLVIAASVCLSCAKIVPWWFTIIVFARELVVTVVRIFLRNSRGVIPAGIWGKAKATLQVITLACLLFPPWNKFLILRQVGFILILITAIITVASGLIYLYEWLRAPSGDNSVVEEGLSCGR